MLSHESLKKDECRKLKSLLLNQLPFFSLTMEMHGTQTAHSKRMKGWRNDGDRLQIVTGMYNVYTETQNKIAVALPSKSIRVGPGRDGRESGGRERPAAHGRAGPFRPERTPFFPSLSVLRTSFHYGKNGTKSELAVPIPAHGQGADPGGLN